MVKQPRSIRDNNPPLGLSQRDTPGWHPLAVHGTRPPTTYRRMRTAILSQRSRAATCPACKYDVQTNVKERSCQPGKVKDRTNRTKG
eukprot:709997-Amphidinium_carterae.1